MTSTTPHTPADRSWYARQRQKRSGVPLSREEVWWQQTANMVRRGYAAFCQRRGLSLNAWKD
jgi:hypothetical protein